MQHTQEATTTRTVDWRVTAFDREDRTLHTTHPLHADAARQQHAYWSKHPSTQPVDGHRGRVTITEEITDKTNRVISLADLPAPGAPTPLPELPKGAHEIRRFHRFSHGPRVHRTGDDARAYLKWLTASQERLTPHTVRVDLTTLVLSEVTLVRYRRAVTLAEVPETA